MNRKRCTGVKHSYSTKLSPEEQVFLYSSYLGKVPISGAVVVNGKVRASSDVGGIRIKVLDAVQHDLNPDICYPLRHLDSLDCVTIDLDMNRAVAYVLLHLRLCLGSDEGDKIKTKMTQMENEHDDKFIKMAFDLAEKQGISDVLGVVENNSDKIVQEKYRDVFAKLLVINSYVDIWFNTHRYVDFLSEVVKRKGINDDNLLLSVANVNGLDNAFWNGSYMTYGDGDVTFYPLVAPDIVAHELTHGLIQSTADLKYQGESGALNESFADIAATSFEFFLYRNHEDNIRHINDMLGRPDWKIGEDNMREGDNLRDMENPEQGISPQPSVYGGKYWVNPHSSDDNGGVHINSGVCNRLFYLVTTGLQTEKNRDIFSSFELFYATLCTMVSKSDYADLAKCLMEKARECDAEEIVEKNLSILHIPLRSQPNSRPSTPMPNPPPPSPSMPPSSPPPSRFPLPLPRFPSPQTIPLPRFPPQTIPSHFPSPQTIPQQRLPYPQYPQYPRYPQYPQYPNRSRHPQYLPNFPSYPSYQYQCPQYQCQIPFFIDTLS